MASVLIFSLAALKAAGFQHHVPRPPRTVMLAETKAGIQFYDNVYEPNVPDVKLTRSRDGQTGVATFFFDEPSFFNVESEDDIPKDFITAMRLVDEEGVLSTAKVNARFVNGQPKTIEARVEMYSPAEWDRFIRFMGRYAEANGLAFNKA
ncbi:hypothetical protein CTAYLR_009455 [Chrysophaeum taylorii]|uniref:Photosystem II reaction center Psb28 protein n=1 Tax=Chrysophaeum taylorii TaxID=2483200 RepID=A0AAD7U6F6_9STRA|nr:hypothetical protein CTAYLR_009455 [Chrysophaeum taylorii]